MISIAMLYSLPEGKGFLKGPIYLKNIFFLNVILFFQDFNESKAGFTYLRVAGWFFQPFCFGTKESSI